MSSTTTDTTNVSHSYGMDELLNRIEDKFILEFGTVELSRGYVCSTENPNTPFLRLRFGESKESGLYVIGDMSFIISIANAWLDGNE